MPAALSGDGDARLQILVISERQSRESSTLEISSIHEIGPLPFVSDFVVSPDGHGGRHRARARRHLRIRAGALPGHQEEDLPPGGSLFSQRVRKTHAEWRA